MEIYHHTLSNGIRIVFKPALNTQVAHFGLTINAGSRDELDDEQGLAHFIEHCLFKGTHKRKAFHILNRMDSVGAELNAYTTKEETVIYTSSLVSHFARAVEIVADIALNSAFPEKEIGKEREVILDEILSYQDSPSELIYDDFEELIYEGHPIGRNILGTQESVRSLNQSKIHHFLLRRYKSTEMVISAVGPLRFAKIVNLVERHFGNLPINSPAEPRKKVNGVLTKRKAVDLNTYQSHLIIGGEAYDNHHPLRMTMSLLNNYLGGPAMNSRLSLNIRERHGIAYHVESAYQPYSDTGLFTIYIGTDKRHIERSEQLIRKELKRMRDQRMSTAALHAAKQQMKGQFALAQEGGANVMMALGKSVVNRDEVMTTEDLMQEIDHITSSNVLEAANFCFADSKLSVITYQ